MDAATMLELTDPNGLRLVIRKPTSRRPLGPTLFQPTLTGYG